MLILREIDREEFKKVMALMRGHNRQGAFQKGGLRTGLRIGGHVENGGVVHYFFGEDGNQRLKHDKFVQFLKDLHHEVCSFTSRFRLCHNASTHLFILLSLSSVFLVLCAFGF